MTDEDLLSAIRPLADSLTPEPGTFTNWLGVRTGIDVLQVPHLDGMVFRDLPQADGGDGVHAGLGEYVALATAVLNRSAPDRFCLLELGAGWGPWIVAAGVVSRRLGIRDVRLVAVEANAKHIAHISEHLARNGLERLPGVFVRHGAAWTEDGSLTFGSTDNNVDYGAAVARDDGDRDYRGHFTDATVVEAFSLETIGKGLGRVDLLHCDIQGAELDVIPSAIDFLTSKVSYLYVATHGPRVFGDLIEFFFRRRWQLLRHDPGTFQYDLAVPSLEGMVRHDGELFLKNPNLE